MILFYIWLVAAPERPVPKRAPPRPKSYPQAEALYDYTASDTDEISLHAGEKLSVLKEGKFDIISKYHYHQNHTYPSRIFCQVSIIFDIILDESGWWTGRLSNGKEGFFPGAYVRKIWNTIKYS